MGAEQAMSQDRQNLEREKKELAEEKKRIMGDAAKMGRLREQRTIDLDRGLERGKKMFGDGSLGRVNEERSDDMKDIVRRKKQIADEGLGAEAFQAARDARTRALQRMEQMQLRNLKSSQGARGVSGGSAQAQLIDLMGDQGQARIASEQDLLLEDAGFKQQALNDLEGSIGTVEAGELARQKFNLDRVNREKFGQMTTQFGEATIGAADRGAISAERIAKEQAQSAQNQSSGGKK